MKDSKLSSTNTEAHRPVTWQRLMPVSAISRWATMKSMDLLKSFSGSDDMISPAITGLIGDCYVNMGNVKEGISYFEKAAKQASNEVISPTYLKKAGIAYESLKQYGDAVKAYTTIKEKYFNSMEASDIDKYITRASALNK